MDTGFIVRSATRPLTVTKNGLDVYCMATGGVATGGAAGVASVGSGEGEGVGAG